MDRRALRTQLAERDRELREAQATLAAYAGTCDGLHDALATAEAERDAAKSVLDTWAEQAGMYHRERDEARAQRDKNAAAIGQQAERIIDLLAERNALREALKSERIMAHAWALLAHREGHTGHYVSCLERDCINDRNHEEAVAMLLQPTPPQADTHCPECRYLAGHAVDCSLRPQADTAPREGSDG